MNSSLGMLWTRSSYQGRRDEASAWNQAVELRPDLVVVRIPRNYQIILFAGITIPRKGEVMLIAENDATLAEAVRKHIILTLASCGGNRTHAAKILNISLRSLRDKLRGYAKAGIGLAESQRPKSELRPSGSALLKW